MTRPLDMHTYAQHFSLFHLAGRVRSSDGPGLDRLRLVDTVYLLLTCLRVCVYPFCVLVVRPIQMLDLFVFVIASNLTTEEQK